MSAPARYDEFRTLYDAVTSRLWDFALEAQHAGQITTAELQWFYDLISGFLAEFSSWPKAPPGPIHDFLQSLEQRSVSADFRVAGHAFLHVAYDLPRVIADTLSSRPNGDRIRLRSLFLRPAPLFREIFMQQTRHGLLGFWKRPLGYLKPAEMLSYWLLSLRSVAWIHAETLADAAWARTGLELQLADGLQRAAQASLAVKGWARVPKLDNSTLLQVASPFAFLGSHPTLFGTAALGLAATGLVGAAIRLRNQVQANRIAYFGTLVYIETTRALQGREAPPPAPVATELA